MRYAIIENGIVTNVVEASQEWVDAHQLTCIASDIAGIGWTYVGLNLSAPQKPLAQAQAEQLAAMDAAYVSANTAPISYMGATFQADQATQDLIAGVLTACGGVLPAGFAWFDINNVPVAMTFVQLQGFAGAILMRGQPLFIHKQTQKALIRAATTVAEVEAVTW